MHCIATSILSPRLLGLQVNERANRLARSLVAAGVQADVPVALVVVRRCPGTVPTLLCCPTLPAGTGGGSLAWDMPCIMSYALAKN